MLDDAARDRRRDGVDLRHALQQPLPLYQALCAQGRLDAPGELAAELDRAGLWGAASTCTTGGATAPGRALRTPRAADG